MDDLDAALAGLPIAAPTLSGKPTERKHRHEWVRDSELCPSCPHDRFDHTSGGMCMGEGSECYCVRFPDTPEMAVVCERCLIIRDEARARRGKSSRRLGHDGERRSERRYGWQKVGEFGGPDDLIGKLFIVQQKTTRAAPPLRWKGIFARLDERAMGRVPVILLSFVKAGVDTEDFVVVRGRDWLALHGKDDDDE